MKLDTILDKVESQSLALPEFQRGYVWNREQVRNLFSSLYRRNPVGSLLVWETTVGMAKIKGAGQPAGGGINIKLLLDGQQRITSAYGVIRGEAPAFFDGNAQSFTGLRFHVDEEKFEFYQPTKMDHDPLWVDVSKFMGDGLDDYIPKMTDVDVDRMPGRISRLNALARIRDIDIYIEEITGKKHSIQEVVDIFNVVNSGGTRLSQGDLTLAKICAEWPDARKTLKAHLDRWSDKGYAFKLDWLLRCVNTVLTGRANFSFLEDRSRTEVEEGLERAAKAVDHSLNLIAGRLGLDHDRVLFGRYAIPVMARYLDRNGSASSQESDKLLFWYLQAAMWGRFSGATVTTIDQDLEAMERGGLVGLLKQMQLWHGRLRVLPNDFEAWSLGARFYPILYLLTRMGKTRDWCKPIALRTGLLGEGSNLEVHHIFPKAQLYKRGYSRAEVNSLANFCFLTADCNKSISDGLPEEYFRKVEADALSSQWIPADKNLWRIENYGGFLESRRNLLAAEANSRLAELLHSETQWMEDGATESRVQQVIGGITSEEERRELEALNDWVNEQGLKRGDMSFDFSDPKTGQQVAVLDLAWPNGVQEGLTSPVAVLLDEEDRLFRFTEEAKYRVFKSTDAFKKYVESDILKRDDTTTAAGGPASPN